MSAIAGILGRVTDDANHAALRRMSAALKHRGPDRETTFQSKADASGNGCLLLHRSLATFDDAEQPFTQGAITITYDGPIFSHPRPADVLASLQSLENLRGMFALAAWDDSARTLMLARDALGHRPLYFARGTAEWTLAFAS